MTTPPLQRPDVDWRRFADSLGGVPYSLDDALIERRSRDFYWFSPILKETLRGVRADLIVEPRDEADVHAVAAACVERRVPLTVRGAGTGNYGQAMPLQGGVVLDMRRMTRVRRIADGALRCEAGLKLIDADNAAREQGWELRLFPSTKRTATIGGFIAGGSSGVGAIQYGYLRDAGNVLGLRVVTMEDAPRILELRGADVLSAAHAYGANGIITEVEIALAPAVPWVDAVAVADDLMSAARFGQALSEADGVAKQEVSVYDAAIPPYFPNLDVPPGKAACLLTVAESSMEALGELAAEHGAQIVYTKRGPESGRTRPLYEFTWNHTTLHAINADPSITYLQTLYPIDPTLAPIAAAQREFGDEVPTHLEFVRWRGRIACGGLPLVRYTTPERLRELIERHEALGITVFDPHTHILEDGGMKAVDPVQLEFKRRVDPHGLMNPGKMRGWWSEQPAPRRDTLIFP